MHCASLMATNDRNSRVRRFLSPPGGIACRTALRPTARWHRCSSVAPILGQRLRICRDLHGIDPISVKGEMPLDLGDRGVWPLIGPYGVDRFRPAGWNAVVGAIALVGTVCRQITAGEPRHIGIPSGNVENRRVACLEQDQGVPAIHDFNVPHADDDARAAQFDGYRMIRSGELHSLGVQTIPPGRASPAMNSDIFDAGNVRLRSVPYTRAIDG
jgi:hypothetical protein